MLTECLQHVGEGGIIGCKAGGPRGSRGEDQIPPLNGLHQEVHPRRLLRLLQEGGSAILQQHPE